MKVFDPKKHDFRPQDKEALSKSDKADAKQDGKNLDDALEETFPASDPPAITTPRKNDCVEAKPVTKKREGK